MAEVLSSLGSLFGSAGATGAANSAVMGKGLLQPDILAQAKDLTQGSGGFGPANPTTNPIFSQSTMDQLKNVNDRAQQNLRNAMPMMNLGPAQQQQPIQQMDLAALLRTLGGGQ
jgi:hypothetical protein